MSRFFLVLLFSIVGCSSPMATGVTDVKPINIQPKNTNSKMVSFFKHEPDHFSFALKATSWNDVPQNFVDDPHTAGMLSELEVLTPESDLIGPIEAPTTTDVYKDAPRQFILDTEKRVFLVQPEGFSYFRYVAELRDFQP